MESQIEMRSKLIEVGRGRIGGGGGANRIEW
jgi:hypothetical protein